MFLINIPKHGFTPILGVLKVSSWSVQILSENEFVDVHNYFSYWTERLRTWYYWNGFIYNRLISMFYNQELFLLLCLKLQIF